MSTPTSVPDTRRQAIATRSGTVLQRQYIYLPLEAWSLLQALARSNNTSVSQLIETFAFSGIANSKEKHDSSISLHTLDS